MAYAANKLLTGLLKDVSRTFYRTLRILPASIRPQISLAYLLARTTDTIADTELVAVDRRLAALENLRQRILARNTEPLTFAELVDGQSESAEKALLENAEPALALLETLTNDDRQLVRQVLETITSGQELDLRRFAEVSPGKDTAMRMAGATLERQPKQVIALNTELELDDYTYRVAGCVGEFWTKMCRAHVFPKTRLDDFFLVMNGKRFGKGLQLVNILRDLPEDLRRGRCYLPAERLADCHLKPMDLLNPTNEAKLRPLYNKYLDRAAADLKAGWIYTNALPWNCPRVRLACAWPVLIGLRTIERLRAGRVLDPTQRIKISRKEVKKIIQQSVLRYPFQASWRELSDVVRQLEPGKKSAG